MDARIEQSLNAATSASPLAPIEVPEGLYSWRNDGTDHSSDAAV
jgi:hypothetical protein